MQTSNITYPIGCIYNTVSSLFYSFTLQIPQEYSEKMYLTLNRWIEALMHPQGTTATVFRPRWPKCWMHSDNTQLDLILNKQMSHFVETQNGFVVCRDQQSESKIYGWNWCSSTSFNRLDGLSGEESIRPQSILVTQSSNLHLYIDQDWPSCMWLVHGAISDAWCQLTAL